MRRRRTPSPPGSGAHARASIRRLVAAARTLPLRRARKVSAEIPRVLQWTKAHPPHSGAVPDPESRSAAAGLCPAALAPALRAAPAGLALVRPAAAPARRVGFPRGAARRLLSGPVSGSRRLVARGAAIPGPKPLRSCRTAVARTLILLGGLQCLRRPRPYLVLGSSATERQRSNRVPL